MRVAIYTLGCKVNQYETQAMEQELAAQGHTLVDFESPADAYIINTCSVTAVSDKKSRQMIRRAKNGILPRMVAACGCLSRPTPTRRRPWASTSSAAPATGWSFCTCWRRRRRITQPMAGRRPAPPRVRVLPAGGQRSRTRAMLKVEDGCVNFCTYCIIPLCPGTGAVPAAGEAVRQTEQLRREGYREVVFTGIEISSWGQDLKTAAASSTCWRRCRRRRERRLRLGSLEPRTVTEDFCRRAAPAPQPLPPSSTCPCSPAATPPCGV